MSNDQLTRRLILQLGAGTAFSRLGIAGIIAISETACTAKDEAAAFTTLSPADAREFEAIAARILPTTNTPGAREAGVIWFIDKTLGTFGADYLADARDGLAKFQSPIAAAFAGAQKFSDLDEADQDRHLRTQEDSGFFGLMRAMTVMGFFGMSKYGGNRDDVGWKLLGLESHHQGWQPPFGYYDAEYTQGEKHGE